MDLERSNSRKGLCHTKTLEPGVGVSIAPGQRAAAWIYPLATTCTGWVLYSFRGLHHMNTHDSLEWTMGCRRANNLGYEWTTGWLGDSGKLPCPTFWGLPKYLHRSYNKLVIKGSLFWYGRFLFGLLWEASLGSKSLASQGEASCKTGKETGKETATKSRSTTVLWPTELICSPQGDSNSGDRQGQSNVSCCLLASVPILVTA